MPEFLRHQAFNCWQRSAISVHLSSAPPVLVSRLNIEAGRILSIVLSNVFLMEKADEFLKVRSIARVNNTKENLDIVSSMQFSE